MSESNTVTREICEMILAKQGGPTDMEMRLARAHLELRERFDEHVESLATQRNELLDANALLESQLAKQKEFVLRERDLSAEINEQLITANEQLAEARKVLGIYANTENWNCRRCSRKDAINCFMGNWIGPVGDDDYDNHGYSMARIALEAIDAARNAGALRAKPEAVSPKGDELRRKRVREGGIR